jgi:hypothetical protein
VPSGATTVSWGASGGGGGLPYTFASHPEIVTAVHTAATAIVMNFDGRGMRSSRQ